MSFLKNKGMRITLLALVLVLLVTAISLAIGNYSLDSDINFVGLGDQRSPYLIETAEDLCRFRDLVNEGERFEGRFVLQTADIDLSDINNFTPIGIGNNSFAGTYNGGGHAIYRLTIAEEDPLLNDDGEILPIALFAQLEGTVQNLDLLDATIVGTKVGGIVGFASSEASRVTNCHSDATLIGTAEAGGIAVESKGNIGACIYNGEMSAPVMGGICAEDSYAVVHCFAPSVAPDTVEIQYTVNNQLVLLSEEDLSAQKNVMHSRVSEQANPVEQFYYALFEGRGHQWAPFLIRNYEELCLLRDMVNAGYSFDGFYVSQTADIDLSAIPWTPIGFYQEKESEVAIHGEKLEKEIVAHYFWGIYDGAGHTVSNLNVSVGPEEQGGLFSTLCGTVMNLGIESGRIEGGYVGSITGNSGSERAIIFNCYSKAELVGVERAGGIADHLPVGAVGNCYFAGIINAPEYGGILGNSSAWLCNCYAVGYQPIREGYYGYATGDRLQVDDLEQAVKKSNSSRYNSSVTFSLQRYSLYRFDENGGFDGRAILAIPALIRQIGVSLLLIVLGVAILLVCYHWYYSKKPSVAGCKLLLSEQWGKWKQNKLSLLVCALFGICSLLTFSALLSGDTLVSNAYVWSHGEDALMDLFNPMKSQIRTNYWGVGFYSDVGETYPPLARALVWLLAQLMPFETVRQSSYAIRTSSYGILTAMFLAMAVCAVLFLVWSKQLKEVRGRFFLPIMILVCPSFVFGLERYNLVLFAFLFCVLFLAGYRSENNFIRNMSYFCLALAAALKIYPVVLGLLVLREKNTKHIVQCVSWGLGVFLIPFAFCGGYTAILHYIRNVTTSFTRYAGAWDNGVINLSNTLMMLTQNLAGDATLGNNISGYILYPLTILLAICALCSKKRWKSLLAVTLILVLFPGFSVYYMAVFYALPLFAMLAEKATDKRDFIYAILLCVTVLPLGFLCGAVGCGQTAMIQIAAVIGVILAILLIVDFAIELLKNKPWSGWCQNLEKRDEKKQSI